MERINFRTEPTRLLARRLGARRTSQRKYRLFAVACCRHDIEKITDPDCRALIDLVERRADGEVPAASVTQLRRKVQRWASRQAFDVIGDGPTTSASIGRYARWFMKPHPGRPLGLAVCHAAHTATHRLWNDGPAALNDSRLAQR